MIASGLTKFFKKRVSNILDDKGVDLNQSNLMHLIDDKNFCKISPVVHLKNLSDKLDKVQFLKPSNTGEVNDIYE